jgi:glycine hydroxymethyltransferase
MEALLQSATHFPSPPLGPCESPLQDQDPAIGEALKNELHRQQTSIELIASENIVSLAVLQAQGSILTNKYAEGYSGRRYYGGCSHVDKVEDLAIERLCRLFGCAYANVQPHSGAQANLAVFKALLQPGDCFMGMSLPAGGHLTHGSPVTLSGQWFKPVSYHTREEDGLIHMDQVAELAMTHKPKLIIAGGSSYPRTIDFAAFRAIADKIGAYLMVDMAHYAGLIAAGAYPSPFPHAHVVTSTTHKTLRGPRGGIILTNEPELAKKMNSAVFPGTQGGPLMHVIAAKAVAFGEALTPEFKTYAHQVVANARSLARSLEGKGYPLITKGTDSHMLIVDLRGKSFSGKEAELSLERAGLTCNKNSIPNDPRGPTVTSGIRLGTPAGTTRGFDTEIFAHIGELIAQVLDGLEAHGVEGNGAIEGTIEQEVQKLCRQYPIYESLTSCDRG